MNNNSIRKASFKTCFGHFLRFSRLVVLFLALILTACKKNSDGRLTVTTKPVAEITSNSAKCGGTIAATGDCSIGACGVCWNETPSPTINNFSTIDIQGTGEFVSLMKNLKPATQYYVRAYATTASGVMYGEEFDFKTEAASISDITIYTNEIMEVTSSTARCGGVVVTNGSVVVAQRGVCWSTTSNPTINCNHTEDGQGVGSFTSTLTSLDGSTQYFVKAYAVTNEGVAVYGDEKQFTSASSGYVNDTVIVYINEVTDITATSAKCGGVVSASNDVVIMNRGVCWASSPNPTFNGAHTTDGEGTGAFTSNVIGLAANTTYYIKAYATTQSGDIVYSSEVKTFSTSGSPGSGTELPSVEIGNVTNISSKTAKCSGNVFCDGGTMVTERGLCWSTSTHPMVYHSHIVCGSGLGSFVGNLTELTPGTTYYVRAYATNSEGTKYSEEEKTFTTSMPPKVITSPVTNIGATYAMGGGNVTNAGSALLLERGICWSTRNNPTVAESHAANGLGTGIYTVSMTNLSPSTNYYVCAYAISTIDTAYGEVVDFRTTVPPQAPTGAINGLFSVDSDRKVWFSQGNLQYKASTHSWRFAPNQYDYIGLANKNISSTYSGWIDLFGWGTSGWNCSNQYYRPWDCAINPSNGYGPYGNNDLTGYYANSDWGYYNAISNGGNQNHQWRTLSHDEWEYLLQQRATISGIRYAKAWISSGNDYYCGLILLPDDWNPSFYALNSTNQSDVSYDSNVIEYSLWVNNLQSHGAVFLTAAGMRWGASTITGEGSSGCYSMSSACVNIEKQGNLYFTNSICRISGSENGGNFRETGQSVRLVQDYQ